MAEASMDERVLVLFKKALFGPKLEHMFYGVVSEPANPVQEKHDYMSLEEMNQIYKIAFEQGKENRNLFIPKKIADSIKTKPSGLVQLVSYSTFITDEDGKIYIFSSEVSKESEDKLKADSLGGLINIFWGGHVSDARYKEWTKSGTYPNPFLLIQDANIRELAEEVRIDDHFKLIRNLGWIYLPNEKDGISPYHIGHINMVIMPSRKSLVTKNKIEKSSLNPQWMLLEEIASSTQQASWTRYVIPIISFMARKGLL